MNKRLISAIFLIGVLLSGCARSPEVRQARFLRRGKNLYAKKEYARAALEFKNAIQVLPKNAEAYYQLALAYLAAGDEGSAIPVLMKASQLDPKHTGVQMKLAGLMLFNGDSNLAAEAQKRLGTVLAMTPNDEEALNMMAAAEWRLGRKKDAEQRLTDVLNRFPKSLRASMALAKVKIIGSDLAGAEKILKECAAQRPPLLDAFLALAEFYALAGRAADASQQFQAALQVQPENAEALAGYGTVALALGKAEEAVATYKRLAAITDSRFRHLYATYLLQTGKAAEGIVELERLLKADPANRDARTRLIGVYLQANRGSDAERILAEALKKNPKDRHALTQRSWVYTTKGKYAEAQADLLAVLRLEPGSAQAHYNLARIHLARGVALQARAELNEALKLDAELLPARIDLARLFIAMRAGREALRTIEEAPAAQRGLLPVIVQRNWALASIDDIDGFRKGIAEGLKLGETNELLLQSALLNLVTNRQQDARTILEKVLAKSPQDLRALGLLARSYAATSQNAALLPKLQEYAAKYPASAPIQEFVGEYLLLNNRPAEARNAFVAARRGDPAYTPAALALATLDAQEGKLADAKKEASELLALSPSSQTVRMLLAKIEHVTGDYRGAAAHYQQIIDADPNDAMAHNNLAYLLLERENRPDEALKLAQRAVELAPNDPDVQDTMGWILYSKGLYGAALQHLEQLRDDGMAVRQYHLSLAYFKTGKVAQGREVLKRAMRLDPSLPEAKLAQALSATSGN